MIYSWDRQKGESEQAYEAFDLYCKMGAERSQLKVVAKLGKSKALISRWAMRHNWRERALDYDRELQRLDLAAKKREIADMNRRQMQQGMLMQKIATKELERIAKAQEKDGTFALSQKLIAALMTQGAAMERSSRLYGMDPEEEQGKTNGVLESILDMERELRDLGR